MLFPVNAKDGKRACCLRVKNSSSSLLAAPETPSSGDQKALVEDCTMKAHQLIGPIRVIFKTMSGKCQKIARQHTVEEGVANLPIIVPGSIGQSIKIPIILVQRERQCSRRRVVCASADGASTP